MAATLVQRVQQITANDGDDFFNADTILFYLNKAQRKIVAFGTQKEREAKRTLRLLDNLRVKTTVTPTLTAYKTFYTGAVNFPASTNDVLYLRFKQATVLRELPPNKLHLLEWGNVVPSVYEGYYNVSKSGSNVIFDIYVSDNTSLTNALEIFSVTEPTDLLLTDTALTSLPDFAENAVVYGAAVMVAIQEQKKEVVQQLEAIHTQELQAVLY